MELRTVWIYALTDPRDNTIRYIGQTCNLKARYYSHIADPLSSTREWIRELKEQKLKPGKVILEVTDQVAAGEAEHKWLLTFRAAKAPLLNSYFGISHDYRTAANWWNEDKKTIWNT